MITQASIVIGLGYGDEGKGVVTSELSHSRTLVVRFNGGHQAGHTVVKDGVRHIFATFGSGTLNGAGTFISEFCTFYPTACLQEYLILKNKITHFPFLAVHPMCAVTTPFDIDANIIREQKQNHGSVGVGFGETLRRHEVLKLHARDLQYSAVLRQKLIEIWKYYKSQGLTVDYDKDPFLPRIEAFMDDVQSIRPILRIDSESHTWLFNHAVFEGAQGVLLDQDFGFFPHVTRSHTTSRNALKILATQWQLRKAPDVYYVTRCYMTRHGNGPFVGEEKEIKLINNEQETNQGGFQGDFRTGEFNPDLIRYAMDCDDNYSRSLKKNLIITCLDQRPEWEIPKSLHWNRPDMTTQTNSSPEGNFKERLKFF